MDPKILIVVASLLGLVGVFIHYRRRLLVPFLLALVLALIWTLYYPYEYVGSNFFVFDRINIYPLVLWAVGLTMLQVISWRLPRQFNLVVTSIIYITLLASFEAVAYHLLDIRLNSNFTSLLGLGVIHAPLHMKVFYLVTGPAYIALLKFLPKLLPKRSSFSVG